jgi:hypothetical protein
LLEKIVPNPLSGLRRYILDLNLSLTVSRDGSAHAGQAVAPLAEPLGRLPEATLAAVWSRLRDRGPVFRSLAHEPCPGCAVRPFCQGGDYLSVLRAAQTIDGPAPLCGQAEPEQKTCSQVGAAP